MFKSVILFAMLAIQPTPPEEQLWQGGIWYGSSATDPDNGKEFKKGAFKYTKKSDYDKYLIDHAEWYAKYSSLLLREEIDKFRVKYDFYNLPSVIPTLKWENKTTHLTATTPFKAYGGDGVMTITLKKDEHVISIVLKNASIEKYVNELGIKSPMTVTGTVGTFEGTIKNNKGYFTGKRLNASTNMLREVDLVVDIENGIYTAGADTTFGKKYISGTLRPVK